MEQMAWVENTLVMRRRYQRVVLPVQSLRRSRVV